MYQFATAQFLQKTNPLGMCLGIFGHFLYLFVGKGLGKEESGISKAIKVNIKTDTAGVSSQHNFVLSMSICALG